MMRTYCFFFWSIVSGEWEEEERTLFTMIIEMWITIRGFSFAKSFLEMYKQANKTSVQKSKGLKEETEQLNTIVHSIIYLHIMLHSHLCSFG